MSIKRSSTARVDERSRSFIYRSHVYPQVETATLVFSPQPQSIAAVYSGQTTATLGNIIVEPSIENATMAYTA